MKCTPIAGGGFVCGPRQKLPQCSVPGCSNRAPFACDFELQLALGDGKPKTCDKKLCGPHAAVQPGKRGADDSDTCHYCPPHDRRAREASHG